MTDEAALQVKSLLEVPDAEVVRQAGNSLRGYIYQVYRTALAWTALPADARLLVEVAEDFSVLCGGILTNTQVKDTAGSGAVTLRTQGVLQTIASVLRFQASNPELRVQAVYLTTSTVGVERGGSFPGGVAGLQYWSDCLREGADLSPLRDGHRTVSLLPRSGGRGLGAVQAYR